MLETISAFLRDILLGIVLAVSAVLGIFDVKEETRVVLDTPTEVATSTTAGVAEEEPNILPVEENAEELAISPVETPPPAPATAKQTPPNSPAVALKSPEEVNDTARAALVNIVCTTAAGGPLNALSGSGVFIDNRGIILTNAHVAQYFLLQNYLKPGNVECVIRTGAPAQPKYRATLLFLPPAWVEENGKKITVTAPTGTGEHDYAFLLVTGVTNPNSSLPSSFPAISLTIAEPQPKEPVLLAAYPAGFLDGTSIAMNLYTASTITTIKNIYTFDGNPQIDLISVGGTIVSQGGSSGGAAVRMQDGALTGIIVTASSGATTAERDLRAITLAHINRSLISAGMGGIAGLLAGSASVKAAEFKEIVAPGLTKILIEAIED